MNQRTYTVGWEGRPLLVPKLDTDKFCIGYGHNSANLMEKRLFSTPGFTVTPDECEDFLRIDLAHADYLFRSHFTEANPNVARQLALRDILYQLNSRFLLKFPNASRAVRLGDWYVAAQECLFEAPPAPEWSLWHHETALRCETNAWILHNGKLPEAMPHAWTRLL